MAWAAGFSGAELPPPSSPSLGAVPVAIETEAGPGCSGARASWPENVRVCGILEVGTVCKVLPEPHAALKHPVV